MPGSAQSASKLENLALMDTSIGEQNAPWSAPGSQCYGTRARAVSGGSDDCAPRPRGTALVGALLPPPGVGVAGRAGTGGDRRTCMYIFGLPGPKVIWT